MTDGVRVAIADSGDSAFRRETERWVRGQRGLLLCPITGENGHLPRIAALCPRLPTALRLSLPEESILIIASGCAAAAEPAARCGCRVLDYGFSLRDTLTLSSVSEGEAAAALLRPMQRLDGTELEPQEWTLPLPAALPPEWLLCRLAILLCAGLPLQGAGEMFLS